MATKSGSGKGAAKKGTTAKVVKAVKSAGKTVAATAKKVVKKAEAAVGIGTKKSTGAKKSTAKKTSAKKS